MVCGAYYKTFFGRLVAMKQKESRQFIGVSVQGYKLYSEKLDRIESEVKRHEEIILKFR